MTVDLLSLPDNTVRIVVWGRTNEDVLYDRIFTEPSTIPQLKEIRDVATSAMGEQESDPS